MLVGTIILLLILVKFNLNHIHWQPLTTLINIMVVHISQNKTQMFEGPGGHKTKTAKGHLTQDLFNSEGQGTQN